MSCYIILGNGKGWSRTNPTYQTVLAAIADSLPRTPEGLGFSAWLTGQVSEARWPALSGIDLRQLTSEEQRLFTDAASQAYEKAREVGPPELGDEALSATWLEDFQLLLEMMEAGGEGTPHRDCSGAHQS